MKKKKVILQVYNFYDIKKVHTTREIQTLSVIIQGNVSTQKHNNKEM